MFEWKLSRKVFKKSHRDIKAVNATLKKSVRINSSKSHRLFSRIQIFKNFSRELQKNKSHSR